MCSYPLKEITLLLMMKLSREAILNGKYFCSHDKSNSCGVLICFIGSKKLYIRNKISDNISRRLVLDVDISDKYFILINLYKPNCEAEQLKTLSELTHMLTTLQFTPDSHIVFSGDFNSFFNVDFEIHGGSLVLRKQSVKKIINLKESNQLTDIRRKKTPKRKEYTFCQKHVPGFLQKCKKCKWEL